MELSNDDLAEHGSCIDCMSKQILRVTAFTVAIHNTEVIPKEKAPKKDPYLIYEWLFLLCYHHLLRDDITTVISLYGVEVAS